LAQPSDVTRLTNKLIFLKDYSPPAQKPFDPRRKFKRHASRRETIGYAVKTTQGPKKKKKKKKERERRGIHMYMYKMVIAKYIPICIILCVL
jgi:hypothetical protein